MFFVGRVDICRICVNHNCIANSTGKEEDRISELSVVRVTPFESSCAIVSNPQPGIDKKLSKCCQVDVCVGSQPPCCEEAQTM